MTLSPSGPDRAAAPSYIQVEKDQAAISLGTLVPKIMKGLDLTHYFKDLINPHAGKAQQGSNEWVKTFGQIGDKKLKEEQIQSVANSLVALLIGRAHPHTTDVILSIITDVATWLFIYDDAIEKMPKEMVQKFHSQLLEIYDREDKDKDDKKKDSPVVNDVMQGFAQIMERLNPLLTPETKALIRVELHGYTQSTILEAERRDDERAPSVAEYKEWRGKTSGTRIMFCLILVALGIDLPVKVFADKNFQKVFDAGVDIVNFANDIISAPKETDEGIHNLVFAYKNEHNIGDEEALDFAGRDLMTAIQTFEEMKTKYDGSNKEEVEKFFAGIHDWDSANYLWSINDSDRYTNAWKNADGTPYLK